MSKHNLPIGFALNGIQTIEFAIIKEAFSDDDSNSVGISLNAHFAVKSIEENDLMCIVEFSFIQKNIPFLKLKVACFFSIEESSWSAAHREESKTLVFPKNFSDHLIALTIGSLRGVLHAKTEGTPFNRFFVPTINVVGMSEGDLVVFLD